MSTPPPLPPSDGAPPPLPTSAPAPPPLPQAKVPQAKPVSKEPKGSKTPPKGKLFPCLNCGAKVEFDPHERALKCPYCGHITKVEDGGGGVLERNFKEYASKLVKGHVK